MSRSIKISLPSAKTEQLVQALRGASGIVGLSLHSNASLKPPGDVLNIETTNEGLHGILEILARQKVGEEGSILTTEPQSLVSSSSQDQIDQETNEASWPEMGALLRRETNVTNNYLMAMFFSGVVAAVGLWTNTVHIVIGAMIIAPGFEPIIRIPFGFLAKQRWSWRQGLKSTVVGYGAMILGAAAIMFVLTQTEPTSSPLRDLEWVQYWSSIKHTSVIIALAAGAAGAAIIAAQRSVLSAGVMIALGLVPSASIAGMALAAGDLSLAGNGLARWALDAVCVLSAGGLVFFLKGGLMRRG